MAAQYLIDTDVLIDYLRDQVDAVDFLENLAETHLISAVSVAELFPVCAMEPRGRLWKLSSWLLR